jgi:hypothetical protein
MTNNLVTTRVRRSRVAALAACVFALVVPGAAVAAAPPNDNYQTPAALGMSTITDGTTVDATTQDGLPEPLTPASNLACPADPPDQMTNTVWFLVTPPNGPGDPVAPRISVSTTGSSTDTVMAVYNTDGTSTPGNGPPNASVGTTNMFGCNDDAGPFSTGSRVEFNAEAGFGYLIQVGTLTGEPPGSIRIVAAEPPGNDDRADATPLAAAIGMNADNMGSSEEPGEDLVCPSPSDRPLGSTAWFKFEAPSHGTATFTTTGDLDSVLQVYRGSATAPITCNDDASDGTQLSSVTVPVTPGTYFIQVGGFKGEQTDFSITANFSEDPDVDDDGSTRPTDCDDRDPARRPGATDVPENGVDEDCSGADALKPAPAEDLDADDDGSNRPADCDDQNRARRPGATDVPGNGIDEDCSGADAAVPRLEWRLGYSLTRAGRVRTLTVRAPFGATIRLTCKGKGCPKARSIRGTGKTQRLDAFFKNPLANGGSIELRATLEGFVGRGGKVTFRKGRSPKKSEFCLQPGSSRPSSC